MQDTIEIIHSSKVQHGPLNNRIYLMELNRNKVRQIIESLDAMAQHCGYGKIIAKIPEPDWQKFKMAGYLKEAIVPGFFNGRMDGFFLGKYFSEKRQQRGDHSCSEIEKVHQRKKTIGKHCSKSISSPQIDRCTPADAQEMSSLYGQIFRSYPFPITKPEYIQTAMNENVIYFCIRKEGKITAVASMEINRNHKNVEMTDFATLPQWRGYGLAGRLLGHMDQEAHELDMRTAYTIARAQSHGINAIFRKNGYCYGGLLKNNTQISGRIESMRVWYKNISVLPD
jgi:putative beta-lysine N-acetyltransferase